jgi:hydroxymethylglutaryl-CoA reductase
MQVITGFSRLNRKEKIGILEKYIPLDAKQTRLLTALTGNNKEFDGIIEKLSENYISNFILPLGIAPNFVINDRFYFVPMVTEESSVVAAAAFAAKFWAANRGFKTRVIDTKKTGQIYFKWDGDIKKLNLSFSLLKKKLIESVKPLIVNMEKRGGGISGLALSSGGKGKTDYYILNAGFETVDSMGANFINSCLEVMGTELKSFIQTHYSGSGGEAEIIMAILSNYTPDCIVESMIECDIKQLSRISGSLSPERFARKFEEAVMIANENISRAVTHNKGLFNGIDAVLLATGNDFRAVEASGHAYAARDGSYKALTEFEISEKSFRYQLRMPLSLGTVGGSTSVHPLNKLSLQIMHNPSAKELMQIVASVGLASNFAAVRSLITEGIQKGHMKLHLSNILNHLNANDKEKNMVEEYFKNKQISFRLVSEYLNSFRETA